jgi:hypothetical protein
LYDTPLTIDEVLTSLTEQPKAIAALTSGLPRARLHRSPNRGEWSLNDVLAHLRSCADMWGTYIATIIAEDRPTIRAMNPTTWIKYRTIPSSNSRPRCVPLQSSVPNCCHFCARCRGQAGPVVQR